MGSQLPPSSLIICSRNRPGLLLETVESVLQGEHVPCELVVIDQSEKENLELQAIGTSRGCEVRWLPSRSVGLCRARNEGVHAARHDVLVFIDDDMLVSSVWYENLVQALVEAGPRTVITGRVLPAGDKPGSYVPALVTEADPCLYSGRISTDVLAAGHMAMYRVVYDKTGPFDERLGAGGRFAAADDNDYGFRLLEGGFQIYYYPQAVNYHRAWRSQRQYNQVQWFYGRGKGGFYSKYASIKDPHILKRAPKDVLLRLLRFPWRSLYRFDLAVADLYYSAGVVSGMLDWLLHEKKHAHSNYYPASFLSCPSPVQKEYNG